MEIVIIGAGNVATCYSHLLKLHGHILRQIVSKTKEHARNLGEKLNIPFTTDFDELDTRADVYILAVKDDALPKVAKKIKLERQLIAHTAGAVNMDVLKNASANYGVIYPLQTIRKEDFNNKKIPLLIEGNSPIALARLKALGTAISDHIMEMNSEKRLKMHFAATFANNFPTFLTTLCKTYCKKEELDYNLLLPLLEETFNQMTKPLEKTLQTGPARRGDTKTLKEHETLLANYPVIKTIYKNLNKHIKTFYDTKGNSGEVL